MLSADAIQTMSSAEGNRTAAESMAHHTRTEGGR